jgi:hypothetical protein
MKAAPTKAPAEKSEGGKAKKAPKAAASPKKGGKATKAPKASGETATPSGSQEY